MAVTFLLLQVRIDQEVANDCIGESNAEQCQPHLYVPFLEAVPFWQ
jgi:hypothetical protein